MTSKQVQIRRDTAANLAGIAPALAELGMDTTNKRLVLGDGLTAGGIAIPSAVDVQKQAFNFGTAGGTANALTLTLTPALLAYVAGVSVDFLATADNTGPATLKVDALGNVNLYKDVNGVLGALEEGDIKAGYIYRATHNGTQFQLQNVASSGGKGWELLAVASGGGSSYDFTSDITNEFGVYAFLLRNLTPQTTSALRMRTRRSGVGSFDTDSNYTSVSILAETGVTPNRVNSGTSLRVVPNVLSLASLPTSFGVHGHIFGYNLGNTGRAMFDGSLMADANYVTKVCFGGSHATGSAIDGVQFYFESGNIDSGEIFMYGVRTDL